jgi:two-component system, OmpR family, phosphate regulon sensor histidine kinase PhoR
MRHVNRAPASDAAVRSGLEQFAAVSSIFDAAEIVVYVADMETYELLFMNKHAEQLWGTEVVGKPCYTVLQAGQNGPCEFCTNPQLTRDGHPVVWEFQNTVNKRWFLCIDKTIPWSDGRLVRMEVAIDITDRKAHEQFREHYIDLISHDLRNPLSTIEVAASILQLQLGQAGLTAAAEPVAAIQRSARRMADMIDDLLETTRLESGQMQLHASSFDLAQLAGTVIRQLGAAPSRPIRLQANGAARVVADAGRIERVLENLVGNALRYSKAGSPVLVQIEANEREVIAAVVDRGVGIPADELAKLFQRFYRGAGNSTNGLGLGLYNSRRIVERHGGRIWVEPAQPGSVFCFSLSAAEQ